MRKTLVQTAALIAILSSSLGIVSLAHATVGCWNAMGCKYHMVFNNQNWVVVFDGEEDRQPSNIAGPCPPKGFHGGQVCGNCNDDGCGNVHDTRGWGILTGSLSDAQSSQFQYVFGGLVVNHGSTKDSLCVLSGDLSNSYLKSSTFILGTQDELYFGRQMDFDDNLTPSFANYDSLTSTQQDSLSLAFLSAMSTKEVVPADSCFGYSSSIKYILELVRTSDNSVLQTLDTLTVYKNNSGQLRYVTSGNTLSAVTKELTGSYQNISAYVRMRVVSTLGPAGLLSWTTFHFLDTMIEMGSGYCGFRQENCTAPSPKNISSALSRSSLSVVVSQPIPNPAEELLRITVSANQTTSAKIEIYDLLGVTRMAKDIQISSNRKDVNIDMSNLAPGKYVLSVRAGTCINSFNVIRK